MLARIQECILYRGFSNGEILDDMTELINLYEADEEALKAREDQFFKSINGLVELAFRQVTELAYWENLYNARSGNASVVAANIRR